MEGLPAPAVVSRARSLVWELCGLALAASVWLIEPVSGNALPPLSLALTLLPFVLVLGLRLRTLQKLRESELRDDEQVRRLLRNQEAQSQALLHAFPDLILRIDQSGNVTNLGGGASADRGPTSRALTEAVLEPLRAAAREALASGEVGRLEYQVQEQGEAHHYEARLARPASDHVLVTVRAATQRRRLEVDLITARETALAAARLKTQFLANMSHEIRTPMNGVIGMTNLLMETPLSSEQHEYAQIIQKSGQTLLTVIDDILDFAKIEAGKLELDEVDFDLYACVDESVEAMLSQAYAKGLELAAVFAPGVPAMVCGDPTRLRQILANLLSNALRYCERGSVIVHVRPSADREDGRIVFTVEDTGPGIAEERQAHLFQPVLLGEGAATVPLAGTGLGLAIARELVQLMGGEIVCRTELEKGSSFEFTARLSSRDSGRGSLDTSDLRNTGAWVLTLLGDEERAPSIDQQLAALGVASRKVSASGLAAAVAERQNGHACLALLLDTRMPVAVLESALAEVRPSAQAHDVPILLFAPTHIGIPERLRSEVARVLSWPVRQSELAACLGALFHRKRTESPSQEELAEPFSAHVLIADDDPINQRVLRRVLAQLGCTCEVTDDGRQAVERVLASHFDAVLMDCQMPWLDGFDATRQIRAREVGSRRNRIVAMTGSSSDEDRRLSREAGMDGFLTKPIASDRLRTLLKRLVLQDRRSTPPKLVGDKNLVEAFLEQAPRNVEAMRAALTVGDLKAVAKTAQQLAGFARALPEPRLETLCLDLERAAQAERPAVAERALEAVRAEVSSVWRSLRESRGES